MKRVNKMDREKLILILSALFHDIGKLIRRAKSTNVSHAELSTKFITENKEILKNLFSPLLDDEALDLIIKLVKNHHKVNYSELNGEEKKYLFILKFADHISAGTDRIGEEFFEDLEDETQLKNFERLPLISIFFALKDKDRKYFQEKVRIFLNTLVNNSPKKFIENLENKGEVKEDESLEKINDIYFFPLKPLNTENIYSVNLKEFIEKSLDNLLEGKYIDKTFADIFQEEFEKLLEGFKRDLEKLNDLQNKTPRNTVTNLEALKTLIKKYMWCVPSSTYQVIPDISLADHLITTSAFVESLYKHYKENWNSLEISDVDNFLRKIKENDNEKQLVYVSIDFSGIQNFIFDVGKEKHRFLTKSLRARSFLVSLILQNVAYNLCKEFDVSLNTILINAGGKIELILPKVKDYREKLENFRKKLDEILIEKYFGLLSFKMIYKEVNYKDLELLLDNDKGYKKFRKELQKQNIYQKYRPFDFEKLYKFYKEPFEVETFENYFDSINKGLRENACELCKKFVAKYTIKDNNNEEIKLCSFCKSTKDIGTKLPKSRYLIFTYKDIFENKDIILDTNSLRFIDDISKLNKEILEENKIVYTLSWEDNNNLYPCYLTINYIPTKVEKDKNEKEIIVPKTFDDLAKSARRVYKVNGKTETFGSERLIVLKADLNRLGYKFIKGFYGKTIKEGVNSISRTAQFSRLLEFFFTQNIKSFMKDISKLLPKKDRLLDKEENTFGNIYCVFSGGDDLFLIGTWDEMLIFINHFLKKLSEFTANNIKISISALFTKGKFDIKRIAHEAEENLEKAKNFSKNYVSKDLLKKIYEQKKDSNNEDKKVNKKEISCVYFYENCILEENEYETLLDLGYLLKEAVIKGYFSKSFLYKLKTLSEKREKFEYIKELPAGHPKVQKIKNRERLILWRPLLYYHLNRLSKLPDENFIEKLENICLKLDKNESILKENLEEINKSFQAEKDEKAILVKKLYILFEFLIDALVETKYDYKKYNENNPFSGDPIINNKFLLPLTIAIYGGRKDV